jgi:hypothetical protein
MPRNADQVIISREEDEFHRTSVALLGTVAVTVVPAEGQSRVFVSDIGASGAAASRLTIQNGTVVIYQQDIPANPNPPFTHSLITPLKCDQGTTCTASVEGGNGRVQINLSGYIRKFSG